SLGVQVHGGTGFVDDAEISQVYRDARIGPIFEGTNYIQAQDLVGRKVMRDKGEVLGELLADIENAARALAPSGNDTHQAPGRAVSPTSGAPPKEKSAPTAPPLAHLQSGLIDG